MNEILEKAKEDIERRAQKLKDEATHWNTEIDLENAVMVADAYIAQSELVKELVADVLMSHKIALHSGVADYEKSDIAMRREFLLKNYMIPINKAPKDGTRIIFIFNADIKNTCEGKWMDGQSSSICGNKWLSLSNRNFCEPTHWMPLSLSKTNEALKKAGAL